jgi:predicted chitinase
MVEAVTRRVNGGLHGLAERRALFARVLNAMDVWKVW